MEFAATNIALSGGEKNLQYQLAADASKTGAGGVLFQIPDKEPGSPVRDEDWLKVQFVMFMSFVFSPTECGTGQRNERHWPC